jgi:hypothetical protein
MMNQKTFLYAAYTFVIFALLSRFMGGATKRAPAKKKALPAPPPRKKRGFFSKLGKIAGGIGSRLIGFDADGEPIYADADEVTVI